MLRALPAKASANRVLPRLTTTGRPDDTGGREPRRTRTGFVRLKR